MDISQAKARTHPRKMRKRVGRGHGSGHGMKSGKGRDGARSRSGWSQRNMTGGNIPLWRRLPKRGFSNAPFKKELSPLNVGRLCAFDAGTVVTPQLLKEQGLVRQASSGGIKILGNGELDRPLTVHAHAFSESAREKIQAAGGTVHVIPGPKKLKRNKMKVKVQRPRAAEAGSGSDSVV